MIASVTGRGSVWFRAPALGPGGRRFESSLPDHYWKPKTRLSRIDENSQSAIIVPFKIEIWPPCSFGTKLSGSVNGSHHSSINLQNSDVGGSRKRRYNGVYYG